LTKNRGGKKNRFFKSHWTEGDSGEEKNQLEGSRNKKVVPRSGDMQEWGVGIFEIGGGESTSEVISL